LVNLQVLCPGIYEPVCGCDSITYENACVATNHFGVSSFYAGECVTSKVQHFSNASFVVYPNPSKGLITIDKIPLNATLSISNVLGQNLSAHQTNATTIELDLSHLASGSYFLQVNRSQFVKILIE
jgi:hypothetical protein